MGGLREAVKELAEQYGEWAMDWPASRHLDAWMTIRDELQALLGAFPQTGDGVGSSTASPPAAAVPPPTPSSPLIRQPRLFELYRHKDLSGLTDVGTVAWGVEWPDKTATLRWHGEHPATAVWPSVEEILAVHGHEGATELRWLVGES
jgi:hypothetical protein